MTSIYETLFQSEVTIVSIFFIFFVLYDALRERKEHIKGRELALLMFNMIFMVLTLCGIGIMLLLENNSEPNSLVESTEMLAFFVALVCFSMFLVLIQASLIYNRLRKKPQKN